eukprot:TRINITY_DN7465_c0_g1_i1.p1 TRINITY_DN7465_c0_g1~~TRINITY_DN7465_c0_g1_i1.p1  ORF type:complete len:167 (-),score=18.03 TRINITY_DN7465_c0_g1_i1:231-731(-)
MACLLDCIHTPSLYGGFYLKPKFNSYFSHVRGAKLRFQRRKPRLHFRIKRALNEDLNETSGFLDEGGKVKDMEAYLNDLSLEYESVWDTKPAWCQPWTICLTGALAVIGSWLVFHSVVLTIIVSALVGAWWYIFLYSYPQAYAEMIAERRQRVKSGIEDTYGTKKQ